MQLDTPRQSKIVRRRISMIAIAVATIATAHFSHGVHASENHHTKERAVIESHTIPHGSLPTRHQTHASTITEAKDGTLLAAWFGGTREGHADVDIWLSRKPPGKKWTQPVAIDDGVREVDGKPREFACWNPVLFTDSNEGTIYLWYKITGNGKQPGYRNWWGAVKTSADGGKTWSQRIWLPEVDRQLDSNKVFEPYDYRAAGPVKNRPLVMPDGSLLCGSSTETPHGWRSHFEHYRAGDWTGRKHGVKVYGPIMDGRSIQPSFVTLSADKRHLGAFLRDDGYAESRDDGRTWTKVNKSPVKTSKGLHAVTTRNGVHFLAFNPSSRTPLSLARSLDGKNWNVIIHDLWSDGKERMDYPTIMQSHDGKLHIVHSYGRRFIHHIVLDAEYLEGVGAKERRSQNSKKP
ncbi:MAG: exo-alpha-sialidase [Pirellulales bacterium]|nr:exo-alpha-sialidase [Pirellulales bacterium]